MRAFLTACSIVLYLASTARAVRAEGLQVSGIEEMVVSVADPSVLRSLLVELGGWTEVDRWRAAPSAFSEMPWSDAPQGADSLLLEKDPGRADRETPTRVRLVQFDQPGELMRPDGVIYDLGGLMDMDFRIADIDATFDQILAAGYESLLDPVFYKFAQFEVREGFVAGPDGEVLALIERISPPLGFALDGLSPILISAHFVEDLDRSEAFWLKIPGTKLGPRFATKDPRGPLSQLLPRGRVASDEVLFIENETGGRLVELVMVTTEGFEPKDFSPRIHLPNRGIAALSYAVSDLGAFESEARGNGLQPSSRYPLTHPVYNAGEPTEAVVIVTPDAAILEFVASPGTFRE